MTRYLRIIIAIVTSKLKPKKTVFDECTYTTRVWPTEVDLRIVNNSVYLFYFELPRWELIFRTDLILAMKKLDCIPLVSSQTIRILRPLKRFQKFKSICKLKYWDEKWVYIEQKIVSQGKLYATGMVKGCFRSPGKSVPTEKLFRAMGINDHKSPPTPELLQWVYWEEQQLNDIQSKPE